MDILLTIAGLIIGISVFLYAVSFIDIGKRRLRAVHSRAGGPAHLPHSASNHHSGTIRYTPPQTSRQKSITALPDELKDMITHRTCPMCAHMLTRDEPLYASNITVGKVRKVIIYGCSYCCKGNR
jgi:hypothetical protein